VNNLEFNGIIFSITPNLRKVLTGSPGSATDKENGIKLIAECINQAHAETKSVKVILENSAGGTNSIGTRFEDLRGIIDHVKGLSSCKMC
jgi:AP endonuclease 1